LASQRGRMDVVIYHNHCGRRFIPQ
jgi:hypothetical protein